MSTVDVYEFLKANPDKSFCNTDLSRLFNVGVSTIAANTRKLRDNGLINYDVQKMVHNGRKMRYLFYCNPTRSPLILEGRSTRIRVDEHISCSPHKVRNKRLVEKNYKETRSTDGRLHKYTPLEPQDTGQPY